MLPNPKCCFPELTCFHVTNTELRVLANREHWQSCLLLLVLNKTKCDMSLVAQLSLKVSAVVLSDRWLLSEASCHWSLIWKLNLGRIRTIANLLHSLIRSVPGSYFSFRLRPVLGTFAWKLAFNIPVLISWMNLLSLCHPQLPAASTQPVYYQNLMFQKIRTLVFF